MDGERLEPTSSGTNTSIGIDLFSGTVDPRLTADPGSLKDAPKKYFLAVRCYRTEDTKIKANPAIDTKKGLL